MEKNLFYNFDLSTTFLLTLRIYKYSFIPFDDDGASNASFGAYQCLSKIINGASGAP